MSVVSSVILLFFICILLGITGMMFGLVIASKVREERDAMQAALGSFFPALLLSGVMVNPPQPSRAHTLASDALGAACAMS